MTDPLVAVVIACVVRVLNRDVVIEADTALLELPAVDSVVIADLVLEAEAVLGVELDPRLVVPETFASPAVLAAALAASGATVPVEEEAR